MRFFKILVLIILCLISIQTGVSNLNLFNLNEQGLNLLLVSRLPRLFSLILAGGGLSLAGLMMQNLTQNKFVSPSTAGTNEFIKLGIVFGLLLVPTSPLIIRVLIAFIFSFGGTILFLNIINKIKYTNPSLVALIGIMLGSIVGSFTMMIAYRFNLIQNLSGWLEGNFALVSSGNYELLFFIVPLIIIAYLYANKIMVASLGNDIASNLGLNYQQVQKIGLLIVSLLATLVTISIGTLPFIGLIVPNVVSKFNGDNFKKNIIPTIYTGIILVVTCDIIARLVIYPYEVSISLVLGIIGSIVFLKIILGGKNDE